jgi:SAM-dependent methyltransferase
MNSRPDWKLPAGTSRGLWAYATDSALAANYDQSLAGSALLEHDLKRAAELFSTAGSLIDLGCGTGRMLVPFAERGFKVLGVDLSDEMLQVAQRKAYAAGVEVPLIRANLVELDCVHNSSFDYAACLFSTLGMIVGADNRRQVLGHIHRILKPGGKLLLHAHNCWFHLRTRAGRRWLMRDLWRRVRGAESGDFEMPAHHGSTGLALHHFTRREIVRELRLTGFNHIKVEPVSLRADCHLPAPWVFPGLRAYGFLIHAAR